MKKMSIDSDMQFGFLNETEGGGKLHHSLKKENDIRISRDTFGGSITVMSTIPEWLQSFSSHGQPSSHTASQTCTGLQSGPWKSLLFRYSDLFNFCSYLSRPLDISKRHVNHSQGLALHLRAIKYSHLQFRTCQYFFLRKWALGYI